MVVALITAAGVGKRFQSTTPKQFLKVKDKPLMIYTLEKFQKNENIDKIIISCLSSWIPELESMIKEYNISKVKWIVSGGNNQPQSIKNCLDNLKNICSDNDIIVVHVANRPMVSQKVINETIKSCVENASGIATINCPEVIVNKKTKEIINREEVLRLQTPQTFYYGDILNAYELAEEKGITDFSTTGDLFIKLNKPVHFVEGTNTNIKITYPEDLDIFESMLNCIKE